MKISHKWGVVAVVLIGPALALMDETVVTVILSQMQNAFQTDLATITWTVNTYFLALAAVIPVAGYLSDRIGSKRVFLAALTLFTAGSALCALSPTKEVLFASRVLQVATCEDAIQLVEHMSYLGHTLTIREMSAYAEPIIEEAMNQLMLITPLREAQGLKMIQDLSQLVYQYLQPFLSTYGVTLDMVKVQGLSPRDERMKGLITLKAFGLSELDAVRHFITMQKNVSEHRINGQYEELEQKLYMIWRETLDRYTNEIIALQAELENTRATIGLRMDAHNTRLQELSQAISSDLRTSASILNISEASPLAAALPDRLLSSDSRPSHQPKNV